jgi:hypothetical protein
VNIAGPRLEVKTRLKRGYNGAGREAPEQPPIVTIEQFAYLRPHSRR